MGLSSELVRLVIAEDGEVTNETGCRGCEAATGIQGFWEGDDGWVSVMGMIEYIWSNCDEVGVEIMISDVNIQSTRSVG